MKGLLLLLNMNSPPRLAPPEVLSRRSLVSSFSNVRASNLGHLTHSENKYSWPTFKGNVNFYPDYPCPFVGCNAVKLASANIGDIDWEAHFYQDHNIRTLAQKTNCIEYQLAEKTATWIKWAIAQQRLGDDDLSPWEMYFRVRHNMLAFAVGRGIEKLPLSHWEFYSTVDRPAYPPTDFEAATRLVMKHFINIQMIFGVVLNQIQGASDGNTVRENLSVVVRLLGDTAINLATDVHQRYGVTGQARGTPSVARQAVSMATAAVVNSLSSPPSGGEPQALLNAIRLANLQNNLADSVNAANSQDPTGTAGLAGFEKFVDLRGVVRFPDRDYASAPPTFAERGGADPFIGQPVPSRTPQEITRDSSRNRKPKQSAAPASSHPSPWSVPAPIRQGQAPRGRVTVNQRQSTQSSRSTVSASPAPSARAVPTSVPAVQTTHQASVAPVSLPVSSTPSTQAVPASAPAMQAALQVSTAPVSLFASSDSESTVVDPTYKSSLDRMFDGLPPRPPPPRTIGEMDELMWGVVFSDNPDDPIPLPEAQSAAPAASSRNLPTQRKRND